MLPTNHSLTVDGVVCFPNLLLVIWHSFPELWEYWPWLVLTETLTRNCSHPKKVKLSKLTVPLLRQLILNDCLRWCGSIRALSLASRAIPDAEVSIDLDEAFVVTVWQGSSDPPSKFLFLPYSLTGSDPRKLPNELPACNFKICYVGNPI